MGYVQSVLSTLLCHTGWKPPLVLHPTLLVMLVSGGTSSHFKRCSHLSHLRSRKASRLGRVWWSFERQTWTFWAKTPQCIAFLYYPHCLASLVVTNRIQEQDSMKWTWETPQIFLMTLTHDSHVSLMMTQNDLERSDEFSKYSQLSSKEVLPIPHLNSQSVLLQLPIWLLCVHLLPKRIILGIFCNAQHGKMMPVSRLRQSPAPALSNPPVSSCVRLTRNSVGVSKFDEKNNTTKQIKT